VRRNKDRKPKREEGDKKIDEKLNLSFLLCFNALATESTPQGKKFERGMRKEKRGSRAPPPTSLERLAVASDRSAKRQKTNESTREKEEEERGEASS